MLKRFEVENFKSFRKRAVLDLSDTKNYEFNRECIKNGLVNKGMIYGKNGCGKSNLGLAIFDLVAHLTDKLVPPNLYGNYLHAELPQETAKFKYVFNFDSSIVEYRYEKKDLRLVTSETLIINEVEVVSYKLGSPLITTLMGAESLKTDLSESKISALKYIRSNAVLNSDNTNSAVQKLFDFVDNMLFFRSVEEFNFIGYESAASPILVDVVVQNHVGEFEEFLNRAGVKCKLEVIEANGVRSIGFVFDNTIVDLWAIASSGTKILALFYYWLQRMRSKKVSLVFIDEFDANYHHELSALIVHELKNINSQVILTTHNTSLMTNDLMRPDCCFLMDGNQITPFCNLTAKELRFAHNIEKMYKAGAFNG